MTDELVPFAGPHRLPTPAALKDTLRRELRAHVARERYERGDVHQPEDVFALVRKLARAHDAFSEYANAFSNAAAATKKELDEELIAAVGENDGVPLGNLTIPDLDETDIRLGLNTGNNHDIDQRAVLTAVIGSALAAYRDTEPDNLPGEDYDTYRSRYEDWMFDLVENILGQVFALGTYSMQVSKVRAYAATLAGQGDDVLAGVVSNTIKTTPTYRGVKLERKTRRKP